MGVAGGSVSSLWRYPVKSMMGENLDAAELTGGGLLGDRAYALVDSSNGKVASAKNPQKWPHLFEFRAAFVESPRPGAQVPAVRITLPDETIVTSAQADRHRILSEALNREVTLETIESRPRGQANSALTHPSTAKAEAYWPDMDGLDHRDTVTDFALPEGTFFDCAVVHLLTTATLERLQALYQQGRFDSRRFRPNIVVQAPSSEKGFVENEWIGHALLVGDEVRLRITKPCSRCVMTTLAQGDLPRDPGILRTIAQHNEVRVGVYASVLTGGTIRRGDAVRIV
jgi:MOSC domain-containing protein